MTSVLEMVLPAALVDLAVWNLAPLPRLALPLAVIVISGAPATVMAIAHEVGVKGRVTDRCGFGSRTGRCSLPT